jgi:hypothetical protein
MNKFSNSVVARVIFVLAGVSPNEGGEAWWSVHDYSARTENLKVLRRHDLSIFLTPTLQSTTFAHNLSLPLSFTVCAFCYTSTLSHHQSKGTESRFSFPLELIRDHFSNQSPSASKLRRHRLVIPESPGHFFHLLYGDSVSLPVVLRRRLIILAFTLQHHKECQVSHYPYLIH